MKRETGSHWKRATFAGALTLIVATALSQPQQPCYRPKTPLGCDDCGSEEMVYCERGCESGTPGRDGSGASLKTYYCYTYGEGDFATWPCDDPNNPVPSGWSMTVCGPDPWGMCCIVRNGSASDQTFYTTGFDGCEVGNPCGGGGGES